MSIENIPKELLGKVQKLLKLQKSAEDIGSLEEAANASAKIREILLKHNLDLHQIQAAGDHSTKEAPVGHKTFDTMDLTKPHEGKWVRKLSDVIARYNMCEVIGVGQTGAIYIIGTPTNVEVVWYMIEQLSNRLREMAKANFRIYQGPEKRNTYIRGYYLGAVVGIVSQLAEAAAKERFNATQATQAMQGNGVKTEAGTTALAMAGMQVKMMRQNDNYIQSNFNVKTRSSSTRSKSIGGRVQGMKDGSSMAIHGGIGTSQRRLGNE